MIYYSFLINTNDLLPTFLSIMMIYYSLFVNSDDLHVEGVECGEDVGGALDDTFPCLWHGYWGTVGKEHGFVPGAEGKVGEVVPVY